MGRFPYTSSTKLRLTFTVATIVDSPTLCQMVLYHTTVINSADGEVIVLDHQYMSMELLVWKRNLRL